MAHPTSPHAGTLPRLSSHWTDWGQWLALITMTVDHLTRYVLPGGRVFHWPYRLSAVCRHGGLARFV